MSEQPTTYRDSAATELNNYADVALHMSDKPLVQGAKLEVHKSLHEMAIEGITVRTRNLTWARNFRLDTDWNVTTPDDRLSPEEKGYTLAT